tara:strand:- start:77 stop:1189 length:1113 start_codon:yes stop_codon:yes gene_type:complete
MYRFLLLALAMVCCAIVALADGEGAADAAPESEPSIWNQEYTPLPATLMPPFSPASSWSGRLNPAGTVFESGFRAFYFDRTDPSFTPIERHVDSVALSYSYDDLHGIHSERLGAYWVGRVKFEKDTLQRINLSLSWATTRLFIDGKLVYEGSESESIGYRFSAGFHLIEVDYINEWHTTDFAVTLTEPFEARSRSEIASQMSQLDISDHDVYYFGTYESNVEGGPIDVELPDSSRPAIVWLDSYEGVQWSIDRPDRPVWVILASYEPGASIIGVSKDRVIVTRDEIGVHSERRSNCTCSSGHFHCENEGSISEAADVISAILGKTIAGYAVAYEPLSMSVRPYDRTARRRLNLSEAKVNRQAALCRAGNS